MQSMACHRSQNAWSRIKISTRASMIHWLECVIRSRFRPCFSQKTNRIKWRSKHETITASASRQCLTICCFAHNRTALKAQTSTAIRSSGLLSEWRDSLCQRNAMTQLKDLRRCSTDLASLGSSTMIVRLPSQRWTDENFNSHLKRIFLKWTEKFSSTSVSQRAVDSTLRGNLWRSKLLEKSQTRC